MYRIILLCLLACSTFSSYSQTQKDSAANLIKELSSLYETEKISKRSFLDSVHSSMRAFLSRDIFFSNRELLELLTPYRKAIWENNQNSEDMRNYYAILSNQAQMSGKDGEMLYYAEKLNELEEIQYHRPSLTSLTIIASYYNSKNTFQFSRQLFEDNKNFISSIPQLLNEDKLELNQVVQSTNMLNYFGEALYHLRDFDNAALVDSILEIVDTYAALNFEDKNAIANIKYAKTLVLYEKGQALASEKIIGQSLEQLNQLVISDQTPDYLKNYIAFTLTDKKIIYFLEENILDSAEHYIQLFDNLYNKEANSGNAYMIMKYKSKLLYKQGLYKKSVDTLAQAILLLEDFKRNIIQDISDMMYAQAKADEQQILLAEAATKQKKTSQQLIIAGISLLSILVGSVLTISLYRRRQRAKFLEFKLNLARSIHDEANPALLYAKALAKIGNGDNKEKSELEKHIEHTMQLIRSLSRDLKSDKQYSISDLITKVNDSLAKLSQAGGFTFSIHSSCDKKRFISYYQFTQLSAILNECITNTIKHAEFDTINIQFRQRQDNRFVVIYQDNGKGWKQDNQSNGIGLHNMKERSVNLNGEWEISNNYPDGYKITFSIILK